jgi:act minimal PKS acyl carrier protein
MSVQTFALNDLIRILQEGSGVSDGVSLGDDILDVEFESLGYDSLAMLETASRIEREYGTVLDESLLGDATTPRAFLELVNANAVAIAA